LSRTRLGNKRENSCEISLNGQASENDDQLRRAKLKTQKNTLIQKYQQL
jgi:hypothetical protein